MNDTVIIAVIGNTSAGKTSFLRSLTRDLSFGEVGVAATTNSKKETGDSNVIFVDTPGFQGAELVREWVEEELKKLERPSPEKIIQIISKHQDRTNRQLQEGIIKHDKIAWQALKDADAILYLVDIRQHPNSEGNLESSYTLLPDNQVQIIFNFLPQDKTKLKKQHDEWDELKLRWGNRGTFIDYDAFHRDFEAEMKILRGIRSKLIDSSKENLMDRYIQKRIGEEKDRLSASFRMAISLINSLSEIRYYTENIPKLNNDKANKAQLYNMFCDQLSRLIESTLYAFCNSILYIWGFQTHERSGNCSMYPFIGNSNQFPMNKLVQLDASSISLLLRKHDVNESVSWGVHFTSKFPWVSDKRIYGSLALQSQKAFLNTFIPCALDFIKKVRERGIATPSCLYELNREDEKCRAENKIKFIMPTDPEYSSIDADFKKLKWKSKIAANEEWIPELFKIFGMSSDSSMNNMDTFFRFKEMVLESPLFKNEH